MKIISLEGENLASLSAPFSINFADGVLADAGLFAISGNTGAGKSTILDAICLSLFDAMPRFSANRRGTAIGHASSEEGERVRSNDVRHILTRGMASGFSQVIFAIENGKQYQARWSVKRARNSAQGRLQAQEMQLTDCQTNQVLATKKTEVLSLIESLIGLNYEQFKRSVLLAQGDFAAFLKAPAKERSELLERITGTELYSLISKQAFNKAKEQEQALALLESKSGEVLLLPPEQQQQLTNELAQINDKIGAAQSQQKLLTWLNDKLVTKQQLTQELDNNKQRLLDAMAAIEQQDSINQILDKIEKAQEARVVHAQQLQHQKEFEQQQQNIAQLQQQIKEQQQDSDEISVQVTQLQQLYNQAQVQYEQRLPDIELAITKTHAVQSQQEQLNNLQQQLATLEQHSLTNLDKLHHNQQLLTSTSHEHGKVQDYLSTHDYLAPLVNQLAFIDQYIQEYSQTQAHSIQYQNKLAENERLVNELESHSQEIKQKTADLQQQHQTLKHKLATTQQAQIGKPLAELEQNLAQYQELHSSLLNEQQLIVQGLQYQGMIGQKEQQHHALELELQQLRQSYRQVKLQFEQQSPLRDEALKALNTAKQVMSLSQHRNTLVSGEPCALCGSLEHPYAKEHSVGDEMIVQLESRFKQLDVQALQSQEQLAKYDVLGKQKADQQQQLVHEKNELQQLIKQLAVSEVSKQRQGQVEHQLAQLINDIEHLKITIKHANVLVKELVELEQEVMATAHQLTSNEQALTNNQQQLTTINSDSTLIKQSLNQYEQQQKERVQALMSLYSRVDWSHILTVDIELAAFKRELVQIVEQYVLAQESQLSLANQLTHIKQQIIVFEEQNAQFETQKKPLLLQQQQGAERISNETELLDKLTQGQAPAALKNELERNIKELQVAHQNASNSANEQRNVLLVTQSKLTQSDGRLQLVTTALKQSQDLWLQWQQQLNLNEESLIELLSYEQSWIVEQRQSQAKLLQQSHQAQAVVAQQQQQLTALDGELTERASAIIDNCPALAPDPKVSSSEQREMVASSLSAKIAQLSEQQFEHRAKLEQHNQGMVRFGELQQAIEQQQAQHQLWQNMKALIGSADGAKFRTFAQSLTLEQMLLGANHHLTELAPRYSLQRVPGAELELQMIDKDMGDDVRSIDSLSGGETFLVSLALALGLGSLTSLQTTIRSLFIDEGFGTLDPDTLEIALSCLDSLQASGRQIGIISHVQGLVERVGTRIQITSKGDGFSTVKLLNR